MTQKTILVVEDNPAMAEGICDALEMEGYAVISALNGLEALARLEESQMAFDSSAKVGYNKVNPDVT